METPDGYCEADLKTAFPWVKDTLLAKWFSGMVCCPEGQMLQYVHAGFASIFERERMLTFEKGKLVDEYVILNPPQPIIYRIAPDGTRACVTRLDAQDDDVIPDPLEGKEFEKIYELWGQPPEDDGSDGYFLAGSTTLSL